MYTFISPVVEQLLDYAPSDIEGKLHYYDLHPEQGRMEFRVAGEAVFQAKAPFSNLENPLVARAGEVIWVNTNGVPILAPDGTLLGYRGSDTDITQRKLAENESFILRQAMASSSVGVVLADATLPDMPLVYANEAFEQMTGYSAAEALGRNCRFLQGNEPNQPALETIRTAIQTGNSGTVVLRNFRKDGTAFWNQLTISPIYNQSNQLTHFLGIQQDVTVQKQSEQGLLQYAAELELRNAQLGTLLKSIPDAVWLKDPEGRYLKANAKFESFFGNKEGDLLGKTDYDFYPTDIAESFRENDQMAIREGKSRVNEEWVTGVNGDQELWETTKTPVIDSHGTLLGVLGVGHNITHRRLAETALRESEARYRIVADNTYNWEFWLAPDKRFVYHSPSCEIITGFSPEALKQDFGLFLNQIHPEDKDLYLHHHLHREAKDNRTEKIQFRIINHEGETRYIEHLCQAIFGEQGQYLGIRGTNVDVTDQKLAEIALARSEKQFRTLFEGSPVSIIIHDKETGEIVDANPAAWQEYGLDSLEELQQQEFWLESPFAFSDALGLIQRAATEGAHTFEWKSGRKKGTDFWEQVHLRPLVVNGIERVLATSFNISARKNAEESLWKLSYDLQERLKELSCLANISQLIETPDISVEELFQSAVELLPLSLQFPRRACASIQLDDRVFLSSNFLLSDYFLREELIVDNKRRGYVALYYSSDMPFLSEEDEMLKMIQRSLELYLANRQAQDSLIEEEERLRLAIAAANQGLYDLDLLTGDTVVSPEYARMLGYEPDEFTETNQAWLDRLHPDDLPVAKQTYIDYIEGLLPEYRMEFRQRHKNGGWVWILSLGKIQEWDDEGRPVRMLGTHTDISARKEVEAALATTASRYKDLFHLAPVGMVAVTENQSLQLLNQKFIDLTGYNEQDIPDIDTWWQTAYPDRVYRESVARQWSHLMEVSLNNRSAARPMEVMVQCKNGESRYFEVGFMPGDAIHTLTFVDIHERKLAENALRRSEASYRELIEFSPVAKVVVDPNQKFSLMNNRFTELTGYTIEDAPDVDTLIGLSYPDENSRAEQSALKDWVIDQVMTQNRWTEPMESTITCKDGARRTVEVGFVKIGGNFIATLVDVTQRRLAEDALRDSEARYRNILEQSPVGIAIHQGETLVFSNPAGLKLLGAKSEAELIGKSITSIMHPDFIAKNFEVLHRMVQGESGLFPIETRLIKLDGTAIEVEMSASLLSNNGEPTIQVIATDITERKRYTKAIEAQNKILKDINWTQSHVVRAPLATMMGLVSFLSQEDYSAFSYEDLLRLINEKANELDNIIRVISEKSYAISTLEGELSHPTPAQTVEAASPQLEFLIVDDDPLIQKMQQAVIVKAGLHTQPSSFLNGRLALDHILQHDSSGKVFFVLLDINMPEMNGWEFLDAIQKQPLLARLEVVILTSSIDIADRIKAQKYPQVVEYMTKPINRLTVTELKDHPKLRSLWEGHS
jgi:PAS domain S-box-containing protein